MVNTLYVRATGGRDMVDEDEAAQVQQPSPEDRATVLSALDPDVLEAIGEAPRPLKSGEILHLHEQDLPEVECEVCGKAKRPWDMAEIDGTHVCRECVGSQRLYTAWSWQLIGWIGAAAIVLLTVAGSLTMGFYRSYLTSPAYALDQVRSAIANKDAATLDAHCDVTALAEQIQQACQRRGDSQATSVFVASLVVKGLTSARVRDAGPITAVAESSARAPDTGAEVPVIFRMVRRSNPAGDRWVVTSVSNLDQITAEFYK